MSSAFLTSLAVWIVSAVLHFRDDGELVDRLRRRDPHAMTVLYDRYGRLTYSIILRIVRNEGTAEDLVQETFLRVWNRIPAFNPQKGVGWLLKETYPRRPREVVKLLTGWPDAPRPRSGSPAPAHHPAARESAG